MWFVATALAWAGCEPTHNADVTRAVELAMERYAAFDAEGFQAAALEATTAAGCLADVVSPEVAAGLHRVRGLQSFLAKDFGDAEFHFAAARLAEPTFAWPSAMAPEDGPLLRRYEALKVDAGEPVPVPDRGSLLVDGSQAETRPEGVPAVLQSVSPRGRTLSTQLLDARDELSVDGLSFQERRTGPYWIAAAVCGAAAAGMYGAALSQRAAFDQAAADGDMSRITSTAAASRGLTITSGVLAAGGGALVGVGFALK